MWLCRFIKKHSGPSQTQCGKLRDKLLLLDCKIHGSHYYECLALIEENKLSIGQKLILKREKQNQYDANAIEIYTDSGNKLGYIPKNHNLIIANLIDQKCSIQCQITAIQKVAWEPISIRLTVETLKNQRG